jgi:hypothetical protein
MCLKHIRKLRLNAVRRTTPALVAGSICDVQVAGTVLSYERTLKGVRFRVFLNVGDAASEVKVDGTVTAGTHADREGGAIVSDSWRLRPDEGVVLRLAPA